MFNISKVKNTTNLFKGNFGLEREVLRVDEKGKIAQTKHPFKGNKYIGLDFAESQIEIVTPVCKSLKEAKLFLDSMIDIINQEIKGEYLWNYSMPPSIDNEEEIKMADLSKKEVEYREYLSKVYGKRKQVISGVHYNFSFSELAIKEMYEEGSFEGSLKEFKNEIYLKIARQYITYEWFIIYLFGNSPVAGYYFC